MKQIIPQPNSNKVHVFLSTKNKMTIHSPDRIFVDDEIIVKNTPIKVIEITANERSKPYPGEFFYELKFELIKS